MSLHALVRLISWSMSLPLWLAPCAAALAGPQPLPDSELAQVRGGDGIHFAIDLQLNQSLDGTPRSSDVAIGQTVDGRTTYMVLKNIGGRIQMFSLGISANTAEDGTSYVALSLPGFVRFTNVGVDSISVQADPRAPVTDSLGRVSLNGDWSMQGQLRLWSH